ncbi:MULTISPECIES: hypothetical protein, partial [Corallococcus]|uniref:hypothetical protein n=1 Tax=Corallococcus TaxID=83461 RepID=UPI001C12F0E6
CSASMATLRFMVAASLRGYQRLRTQPPSERMLINSLDEGILQGSDASTSLCLRVATGMLQGYARP